MMKFGYGSGVELSWYLWCINHKYW